ncbi:MAG: hypothetical protein WD097_05680 [Balneolales bacterium]
MVISLARYLFAFSAAAFIVFLSIDANAQVTIAPTALFIDDQSRFGSFLVLNGSNEAQEVSLLFEFGYPDTDDEGNSYMNYEDEEARVRYSMADWIRGFPRNFILAPGERQTVRLTVRPPGEVSEGTYWTRIKTVSNPAVPDIDEEVTEGVQAQITFRFEQVTAGFYKRGNVTTGIHFNDLAVDVYDNQGIVRARVERTGNSPFLGSIFLIVRDANNNVVYEHRTSTTVYIDAVRRIEFDASELPPGSYTAEVRFESWRPDISSSDIVQADDAIQQTTFNVP